MNADDVIRALQDGWTLIQPIEYSDKEPGYWLVQNKSGDYRERVSRRTVEVVKRTVQLEYRASSNWRRWWIKRH